MSVVHSNQQQHTCETIVLATEELEALKAMRSVPAKVEQDRHQIKKTHYPSPTENKQVFYFILGQEEVKSNLPIGNVVRIISLLKANFKEVHWIVGTSSKLRAVSRSI